VEKKSGGGGVIKKEDPTRAAETGNREGHLSSGSCEL